MSIVVYKLGGSLLDLPDLADRLRSVFSRDAGSLPLLIVGGGAAVDLVRSFDRIHGLGDETAHQLALCAMTLNERLVARVLASSSIVRTRAEVATAHRRGEVPILCVRSFLKTEEVRGEILPHTWDVTADSIAAWITIHWPADRLVLLKSIEPCKVMTKTQADCLLSECVESPTSAVNPDSRNTAPVDANFDRLSDRIPQIEWVNLRSAEFSH